MGQRLRDKVVVVTGGAGFLGQQYIAAIKREGGTAISLDLHGPMVCDITDRQAVAKAAQTIEALVGPVSGLINNAAINPKVAGGCLQESGKFETLDPVALQREWNVGIIGAINCCQEFGVRMTRQGSGSIVNIASELGLVSPNQGLYPAGTFKPIGYSLIKHATVGLTRWLATYWAKTGVRVNAFAPGGMENGHSQAFLSKRGALIPMKRMAQVGEFDGPIVFLLSDESSYMTGAVLSVDGGYTAW